MNKDELKYLIEDLHKNELSKTGKIKLEIYIIDLQHQLQTYKDKEDKLEKLQQEKNELIKWLKEEIKNADDKSNSISNLTNISYGSRSYALKETLERLG